METNYIISILHETKLNERKFENPLIGLIKRVSHVVGLESSNCKDIYYYQHRIIGNYHRV